MPPPSAGYSPLSPQAPFTLVALHENGGSELHFARLRPCLPPTVHLHTPALPGFAGRPADHCLENLADYAFEISETLLSLEPPLVLLGHGMGGAIALELCQYDAEKIQAVILHAPASAHPGKRPLARLMALPAAYPAGRRIFTSRLLRPLSQRMLFTRSLPADYLETFFNAYRDCAVFNQMNTLVSPEWFASLLPMRLPAVLLWGSKDRMAPSSRASDFRRLLPHSTIHIQPGWGHYPMIEQPEEYSRVIIELAQEVLICKR